MHQITCLISTDVTSWVTNDVTDKPEGYRQCVGQVVFPFQKSTRCRWAPCVNMVCKYMWVLMQMHMAIKGRGGDPWVHGMSFNS